MRPPIVGLLMLTPLRDLEQTGRDTGRMLVATCLATTFLLAAARRLEVQHGNLVHRGDIACQKRGEVSDGA